MPVMPLARTASALAAIKTEANQLSVARRNFCRFQGNQGVALPINVYTLFVWILHTANL